MMLDRTHCIHDFAPLVSLHGVAGGRAELVSKGGVQVGMRGLFHGSFTIALPNRHSILPEDMVGFPSFHDPHGWEIRGQAYLGQRFWL